MAPDGTAFFSGSSIQGCFDQPNPGGLYQQPPGETAAFLRQSVDTGGVAIDASGRFVTAPPGLDPAVRVQGVAISRYDVLVGSRDQSECGIDPPCFYLPPSGLYASRGSGAVPVGFVPSEVRALGLFDGRPVVSADGALYTLFEGGLEFAGPFGRVRAIVPEPGQPGSVLAFSPSQSVPPPPYAAYGFQNYPNAVRLGDTSGAGDPWRLPTVAAVAVGDRLVTASRDFGQTGVFVSVPSGWYERRLVGQIGSLGAMPDGTLYAGVVDSLWYEAGGARRIFRSEDRGDTWVPDDAGMTARNVFAFASVGTGAARLDLAGTNAGVFARTPGGPWSLAGLAQRRVLTFYAAPDGLLAGTDDGLFRRDAAGAWTRYGAGLDGRTVYAVLATTDAFGPWIGVGTDAGLFQTRAFGVTSEAGPATGATAALTVETLPNPARGVRTVRIAGAAGTEATVAVYDLLGRRVATLGTVALRDGRGEAAWSAARLPAGVYVVRVVAGAETAAVRATVLQ